ncbi:LicD family protein [Planctomycetota bacterium]
MHRLRYNDLGEVEYLRGIKYASKLCLYAKYLKNLSDWILPANANESPSNEFDIISKLVIFAGVPCDNLESLGPITYLHGNRKSDGYFMLEHETFFKCRYPFNIHKKINILLIKLMKILPYFVLIRCDMLLQKYLINAKTVYTMKICHPKNYFNNFSTIRFHGMTFKCPNNVNEYLERIFGTNWRTPDVRWGWKDSPLIFKKNVDRNIHVGFI